MELRALSSRKFKAIAAFLNFYVSHSNATSFFLRNGDKYYIYFIDHLLLFLTVKEFSKSVNSWWSYRKKFDTMYFFCDTVYMPPQCPGKRPWTSATPGQTPSPRTGTPRTRINRAFVWGGICPRGRLSRGHLTSTPQVSLFTCLLVFIIQNPSSQTQWQWEEGLIELVICQQCL